MEQHLITNEESKNFFNIIKGNLSSCHEFKICVSFIRVSGAQLLVDILKELDKQDIKGQILTSTYMNVTQPDALEMLSSFKNVKLKIYTPNFENGFHAKGYLFLNPENNDKEKWTIIVGSSNISGAAFKKNVEWNILNHEPLSENKEPSEFSKSILEEFDKLWQSPFSKDFSDKFLISYRDYLAKTKKIQKENKEIFSFQEEVITPNSMQSEAITKLAKLRNMYESRALAIAATGTGKTYMSVFDAMQVNPKRCLFVVHRGDILIKAKESFDKIISKTTSNYSSGIFDEKEKNNFKYLFATESMLALHLNEFAKDDFDYIIIDEAHHAADNSYTKIINYFTPKFLLGLTATPERTDGKDIFGIFDFNRAVNIRLRDSLEKDLVCPFHYFGIKEVEGIDYSTLKHNPEDGEEYLNEVSSLLMKSKRVDYILEKINFYKHDGDKTKALGFCATVKHAEFMAAEFNKILGQGSAIALSGNNCVTERQKYLKELESDDTNLKYIFTRDIFNEGIDIQDVNLVLMLRPTQSSIVFTQQLGRGLRKIKGKEFLTVLDFIGNYQKSFLVTSVFSKEPNPDKKTRLREVATDFNDIPGDTFIHFDPIVKEQILRQIDSEKFMSDSNQKKAYFTFRKDIGNKIPCLTDYLKASSDLDPIIFTKIKMNGKLLYQSYFEFVVSAENQINSEYSDSLNQLKQNSIFTTFMKFLNTLLPAKRIEEWCILKELFENPDKKIDITDLEKLLPKYVDYDISDTNKTIKHACNLLSGKYWDANEQKSYSEISFVFFDNKISLNENVKELFKNQNMKDWIFDSIEYAIMRYEDEFGRDDYGFPFFKPYAKYSMKQVAPLCCYEKIHSSFRGSGLITSAKPDYFIFVDLYKEDSIRAEINYNDKFITPSLFQWESPNDMTQDSDRGKDVIQCEERKTHLHLFVRKFKEVENIAQDYIYLGDVVTHKNSAVGEKPVKMNFALHELPQDLYNDFITKVDITKTT